MDFSGPRGAGLGRDGDVVGDGCLRDGMFAGWDAKELYNSGVQVLFRWDVGRLDIGTSKRVGAFGNRSVGVACAVSRCWGFGRFRAWRCRSEIGGIGVR